MSVNPTAKLKSMISIMGQEICQIVVESLPWINVFIDCLVDPYAVVR
jgi:hypothetical protein